jgi:uncharacterized protein YndB with AHSA1/START domain
MMNDDYGVLTAPGTVQIERLLPGPIERLWAYLTESDKRAQWLAAGDMALQVGGDVALVFRNNELTANDEPAPEKYRAAAGTHHMHGRITACEPPHVLAHTWGDASEVRFELTPRGQQVLLVVTHTRLPDADNVLSVSAGWHAHLGILRDRLEGREPAGFWATHTRLEAEYAARMARP